MWADDLGSDTGFTGAPVLDPTSIGKSRCTPRPVRSLCSRRRSVLGDSAGTDALLLWSDFPASGPSVKSPDLEGGRLRTTKDPVLSGHRRCGAPSTPEHPSQQYVPLTSRPRHPSTYRLCDVVQGSGRHKAWQPVWANIREDEGILDL